MICNIRKEFRDVHKIKLILKFPVKIKIKNSLCLLFASHLLIAVVKASENKPFQMESMYP